MRLSLRSKRNQEEFDFKQEQLEELKELESQGYLDLYFGDENHFLMTPCVPHA